MHGFAKAKQIAAENYIRSYSKDPIAAPLAFAI
jgi:hypothetical protein